MLHHFTLVALSLTAVCCSGNPVIVLDDNDGESSFSKTEDAHKGTYQPCLEDAYNGQFVHDWATNKGKASATFWFDPPKNGCYAIEEHHPGSDFSCSRYLPTAAKLQIGYCYGKTKQLEIDQSKNGGKWNKIATLPFFKGNKGYFKLSNSAQDSCSAESCFWVADAFRVTWIGASCSKSSINEAASSSEVSESSPERDNMEMYKTRTASPVVEKATTQTEEDTKEIVKIDGPSKRGTLSLVVTSGDSDLDLELKIKNLGVLEAGLKAHFGYGAVDLLSIDVASQRRLGQAPGNTPSLQRRRIDVVFEGKGDKEPTQNEQSLPQLLQDLFDAKDAGIQVISTSVDWTTDSTEKPLDSPASNLNLVILASCLGGGLGLLLLIVFVIKNKKMTAKPEADTKATESSVPQSTDETKEESPEADKKEEEDLQSVSTAPPTSDADVVSDTASVDRKGSVESV